MPCFFSAIICRSRCPRLFFRGFAVDVSLSETPDSESEPESKVAIKDIVGPSSTEDTLDCNKSNVESENNVDEIIVLEYVLNDDFLSKVLCDFAYLEDCYCDDSLSITSDMASAFHVDMEHTTTINWAQKMNLKKFKLDLILIIMKRLNLRVCLGDIRRCLRGLMKICQVLMEKL